MKRYDKQKLRGLMMVKTDRGTIDHPNEDKIFKYLDSTPQQMAERIKELESKVAYFNTLEFYDDQPRKGSVDYLLMSEQLKESQQEVKKLLSGISMIKDLYSLDAVYDKCIELLTKQNKEG